LPHGRALPKPGHEDFGLLVPQELLREPSRYLGIARRRSFRRLKSIHECGGSAMNWDQIEGNWVKAKGKLRQQWGKLTDDDLTLINGKREELAGRLQERYGYQKDQAEKEIDSWMKKAS
jgi:uncharacterized protein YjbJ (UPF0337 family)